MSTKTYFPLTEKSSLVEEDKKTNKLYVGLWCKGKKGVCPNTTNQTPFLGRLLGSVEAVASGGKDFLQMLHLLEPRRTFGVY